jgi:hypothetical protein
MEDIRLEVFDCLAPITDVNMLFGYPEVYFDTLLLQGFLESFDMRLSSAYLPEVVQQ